LTEIRLKNTLTHAPCEPIMLKLFSPDFFAFFTKKISKYALCGYSIGWKGNFLSQF